MVCSGSRVFNHQAGNAFTWERFPRSGDCEGRTFQRLAHIPSYTREALSLDLVFLDDLMCLYQPSHQKLTLAMAFLDHCRAAELDHYMYDSVDVTTPRGARLREFFSQALACFLDGDLAYQEDIRAEDVFLGRHSITEAISLFFPDLAQPMTRDQFDELCHNHSHARDRLFELVCDLIVVFRPENNLGASPLRIMGDSVIQQFLVMAPLLTHTTGYRIAVPTLLAAES